VANAVQVMGVSAITGNVVLAAKTTVSGSAAAEGRGGAFSSAEGPERLMTSRTVESNVRRSGAGSPTWASYS
jgi:hypothetical protein